VKKKKGKKACGDHRRRKGALDRSLSFKEENKKKRVQRQLRVFFKKAFEGKKKQTAKSKNQKNPASHNEWKRKKRGGEEKSENIPQPLSERNRKEEKNAFPYPLIGADG